MRPPVIGTAVDTGDDLAIDFNRLIVSRLLIQANSGGGKSWALRRLLEQTYGLAQQIVIDPEDEFYTLRERHDYILAGRDGGDCPAEPRSAHLLARRLLELNISCIIGIYELPKRQRVEFVKRFLGALIDAPKDLWHPALIVVDEAHDFCPEGKPSESAEAVIDLAAKGRKRGFCAVLATQRISKLSKDAAAECNNKLIGRSVLDIDRNRAGDELGFSERADKLRLRELEDGQFFAFGPALSRTAVKIKTGPVQTTHPDPLIRKTAAPPAPSSKVKAVLAELADLPKEAVQEAQDVATLQRQVADLRRDLAKKPAPGAATTAPTSERDLARARDAGYREGFTAGAKATAAAWADRVQPVIEDLAKLREVFGVVRPWRPPTALSKPIVPPQPTAGVAQPVEHRASNAMVASSNLAVRSNSNGTGMSKAERKFLIALAQQAKPLTRNQIAIFAGYSSSSRHVDNTLTTLRLNGWITGAREAVEITPDGLQALGAFDPLPIGEQLRAYWIANLDKASAAFLREVCAVYPDSIDRDTLAERANYSPASRHVDNTLTQLRIRDLVSGDRSAIRASETLFG